jgi:hypothetical protein
MLAAIPSREPQISKQAPLPPVQDVPVEAAPNLGVMQQMWVSISVSRSRCSCCGPRVNSHFYFVWQSWWLGFPAEVRSVAATTAISCFVAVNLVALLMWISIRRGGLKQD